MVKVEYYETATMRKNGGKMKEGQIKGTFFVNIVPEEIPEVPPVNPELKGKAKKDAETKYAKDLEKRQVAIEESILTCKFRALDKVRELIGIETAGVLVASIVEEEE